LPSNRRIWVHAVIVYPWQVKWSDNGNMICSFSPFTTLWNGVIHSYSACKLPLNRRIWVHAVIVYRWRVKWSDNGNMICSFFPLTTLWNGMIHSYSVCKLPLNRRIWVHVAIVYSWQVKLSDDTICSFSPLATLWNMICSFFPLAILWNGVIHSCPEGELPLKMYLSAHSLSLMSEVIGNMICSFSQLLHCKMVWSADTQKVSCLWIDKFECT